MLIFREANAPWSDWPMSGCDAFIGNAQARSSFTSPHLSEASHLEPLLAASVHGSFNTPSIMDYAIKP